MSQSSSNIKKNKKSSVGKINGQKKTNAPSISISKIDESYNADKAPDTFVAKEEVNEIKIDNKTYLQDIPSENSSGERSNKVSFIINNFIIYYNRIRMKKMEQKKY